MGTEIVPVIYFPLSSFWSLTGLPNGFGLSSAPSLSFDCSIFPDSSWFIASNLSFRWFVFLLIDCQYHTWPQDLFLWFSQRPLKGQLVESSGCLPPTCVNPKSRVFLYSLALVIIGRKSRLEICSKETYSREISP